MKRTVRWIGLAAFATFLAMAAGCSANAEFVYAPNPPAADARKLSAKVSVLPFEDDTENFLKRVSAPGEDRYNLAKAGVPGVLTAMPPEFWGKSFADELEASGSFRAVRFVRASSEYPEAEFSVDGALERVIYVVTAEHFAGEFLVSFRATRRSDKKVVWQKEVRKAWADPREAMFGGGITGKSGDVMRARWNSWLGAVLAEARADFVATIASPDAGAGEGAGTKTGTGAGESVERTIERIIQGK